MWKVLSHSHYITHALRISKHNQFEAIYNKDLYEVISIKYKVYKIKNIYLFYKV